MAHRKMITFPTEADARAHVAIIDAAERRPICDCGGLCPGDHASSGVRRGSKVTSVCICAHRTTPDPACPYITATTLDVYQLGQLFAVDVDPAHGRAGTGVSGARAVGHSEALALKRRP